jgi:hypothetical protein
MAKFSNSTIPPDILIIYCDLLLTIFSINQLKKANKKMSYSYIMDIYHIYCLLIYLGIAP